MQTLNLRPYLVNHWASLSLVLFCVPRGASTHEPLWWSEPLPLIPEKGGHLF